MLFVFVVVFVFVVDESSNSRLLDGKRQQAAAVQEPQSRSRSLLVKGFG
jgi:hypothetical protein